MDSKAYFEKVMQDFNWLSGCKLNNLNFGHYIEDILTRIVNGEGIEEEAAKVLPKLHMVI